MRLWHPVKVQETLLSTSEDRLAVDLIVRVDGGVQDVSGFGFGVDNFGISLLGQVTDSLLVLLGKILAEGELGFDVVTLGDQMLLRLKS